VRNPSTDEFDAWQEAAGGLIRIVTLAPERPGALDFIRYVSSRGVTAALGHTGAPPGVIREAAAAGARLSTHLGNGITSVIDRHNNPIWEQIASDALTASLIADSHHLPPAFIRTVHRAKGPGRVVLVSDASPPGGMPPGHLRWAGMDVEVNAEGRVSLSGTPYLAGAGHLQDRGVEYLLKAAGCPVSEAAAACTSVPAALIGLQESAVLLEEGSPADVTVFRVDEVSGRVSIAATVLDGEFLPV
jgi:N-acetylglucosamine-6-phosphate deacetylase